MKFKVASFSTRPVFLLFLMVFMVLFMGACSRSTSPVTGKEITIDNHEPAMAMLSLRIAKADGGHEVAISHSVLIPTTRVVDPGPAFPLHENDFLGIILNGEQIAMDSIRIIQPLHPRFEYPLDDQTIGSSVIELDETEVMIRFSHHPSMKYLRVERVGENSKLSLVDTLPLLFED